MISVVRNFSYVLIFLFPQNVFSQRYKTIYQRIQQDPEHYGFNSLIRLNRIAKMNLHYEQLTVFAPENDAFGVFNQTIHPDFVFYHMSFEIKTLYELNSTNTINSVVQEYPPLWITRVHGDIFVNNAKILQDKSDYVGKSRSGDMGKQQVLHVIDEVLNPYVVDPKFSPNAYDFLANSMEWNIGAAKTMSNFFTKIQEHKLQYIYKQNAGHTFFIPLDSGIDAHKFKMINKQIVLGHIIPYYVLFTRPTQKNFAYESLANDEYTYIVLSLEILDNRLYVKGFSRGSINDGTGEFRAEIVLANIPVKNGVVHLISQPLGIFKRKLKPFPYLPILDKFSTDPRMDVFYEMGERSSFNKIFNTTGASFTFFVPEDTFWMKANKENLKPTETDLQVLRKHLIISKNPYSIEQLHSMSKANNYTDVELETVGGILRIVVLLTEGEYYIKWHKWYIKVLRPNYECTNGMLHLIAGPLIHLRKIEKPEEEADDKLVTDGYWKTVKNAWGRIFS